MGNLDLTKIISPELIKIQSVATNKEEILTELGELLVKNGNIEKKEIFLKDVYKREALGETGIGQGVAIPHGKSSAVIKTTVAIATLAQEIEWETLDERGVNVVILFAVQDTDANTTHIMLLQKVAMMLANDDFIEALPTVKTAQELMELINQFSTAA